MSFTVFGDDSVSQTSTQTSQDKGKNTQGNNNNARLIPLAIKTSNISPSKSPSKTTKKRNMSLLDLQIKKDLQMFREKELDSNSSSDDLWENCSMPILKLPNECLYAIFKNITDLRTLLNASCVCGRWRRLLMQPFIWRGVSYYLTDVRHLKTISNSHSQQLQMIQKLKISTRLQLSIRQMPNTRCSAAFKNVQYLQLDNVDFDNIQTIATWLPNITALNCRNIQASKTGYFMIPNLTTLKNLKSVKLQFSRPSSIIISHFSLVSNRPVFPEGLKYLEVRNNCDEENRLISKLEVKAAAAYIALHEPIQTNTVHHRAINDWYQLENRLLHKYTALLDLDYLTSLHLDKVSSFTARVWRECLIPCGSNLRYLTMVGWTGDNRESPDAIIERINTPAGTSTTDIPDVDLALSQFISSLLLIEVINLDDFICSQGVINGLNTLVTDAETSYIINDDQNSIGTFLNTTLHKLKISIKRD